MSALILIIPKFGRNITQWNKNWLCGRSEKSSNISRFRNICRTSVFTETKPGELSKKISLTNKTPWNCTFCSKISYKIIIRLMDNDIRKESRASITRHSLSKWHIWTKSLVNAVQPKSYFYFKFPVSRSYRRKDIVLTRNCLTLIEW